MSIDADRPPRILVVEDNYTIAEELADFVRTRGYAVGGMAGSVEQSLRLVTDRSFDGAIIDIDLSGRPSFPVCHALRSRGVPFLFLTGHSATRVPHEFDAAPYLLKPVQESALGSALDHIVSHRPKVSKYGNAILDTLECESLRTMAQWLDQVELRCGDILDLPADRLGTSIFQSTAWYRCSQPARPAAASKLQVLDAMA